jgi:hypothetical protein
MDQGIVALQRRLRALAPDIDVLTNTDQSLELSTPDARPPRLVHAEVIEGSTIRARRVFGDPIVKFAAFLDGTQTSRVLAYVDGVPIVHGTVAAAVRIRRNRRLTTWHRPVVGRRLYTCRRKLSPEHSLLLQSLDVEIVDTTPATGEEALHPFVVREEAVHRVQEDRERAERELAERWCQFEHEPLFIDGSISGSERVATSSCTVGVVKSHRTLYADGVGLQTIIALRRAERSTVFRVTSPKRMPVASWYLRMRDSVGHDPMWGLVRVEIASPMPMDRDFIGRTADEISRWILAEATPLSMPDARWDKMVYGIRDCEEFLRAVT